MDNRNTADTPVAGATVADLRDAFRDNYYKLFNALLRSQGSLCFYCQTPPDEEGLQVDHLTPLIRGGSNAMDNLVLACRTCNFEKGSKTKPEYDAFRAERVVCCHCKQQLPQRRKRYRDSAGLRRRPIRKCRFCKGYYHFQPECDPKRIHITPYEKLLSDVTGHAVTIELDRRLNDQVSKEVAKLLASLQDRDALVIRHRYGVGSGISQTLEKIGKSIGVTRERVRQLERRALRILRSKGRRSPLLQPYFELPPQAESESPKNQPPSQSEPLSEVGLPEERSGVRWTDEDEQILRDLFEAGYSYSAIASELLRSRSAVVLRLEQVGLLPKIRGSIEETYELLLAGMDLHEIAEARGLATSTIVAHLETITEEDSDVDLSHVLPDSQRFALIQGAFIESGDEFLKPVKELLGDEYTYEEIRVVRMALRQSPA